VRQGIMFTINPDEGVRGGEGGNQRTASSTAGSSQDSLTVTNSFLLSRVHTGGNNTLMTSGGREAEQRRVG